MTSRTFSKRFFEKMGKKEGLYTTLVHKYSRCLKMGEELKGKINNNCPNCHSPFIRNFSWNTRYPWYPTKFSRNENWKCLGCLYTMTIEVGGK